jgi:SNF2 family DNA or RNA helicase
MCRAVCADRSLSPGCVCLRADRTPPSSKVLALLDEFDAAGRQDPNWKMVVFSQWTSMLDLVQSALQERRIMAVRLDGSMQVQARQRAIRLFREDPSVKVFLISLKAGGLGLNLTAANKVVLIGAVFSLTLSRNEFAL